MHPSGGRSPEWCGSIDPPAARRPQSSVSRPAILADLASEVVPNPSSGVAGQPLGRPVRRFGASRQGGDRLLSPVIHGRRPAAQFNNNVSVPAGSIPVQQAESSTPPGRIHCLLFGTMDEHDNMGVRSPATPAASTGMTIQRDEFQPRNTRNTRNGGLRGRRVGGPFRVFRVFRGSGLAHHRPNTMPNHSVEANRRPAAPLEAGQQFGSPFSARPDLPAAVAHLVAFGHESE